MKTLAKYTIAFACLIVVLVTCGVIIGTFAPFGQCVTLDRSGAMESDDSLISILTQYRNVSETSANKEFLLEIFNNPFDLDTTYVMSILITNSIVYSGRFQNFQRISIPLDLIKIDNEVKIVLTKNGRSYIFTTVQLGRIDLIDDFLQIVFTPDREESFPFYFIFTRQIK